MNKQDPDFAALRREANAQGGALLCYYALLYVAVFTVMFGAAIVEIMRQTMDHSNAMQGFMDAMTDAAGLGYLLAVLLGFFLLLAWKKPKYLLEMILQKRGNMTVKKCFALLSLTMAPQLIGQACYLGLGWLLEACGRDVSALESVGSVDVDTVSMFLYVGVAAPIAEELLFRGLLLRSIAPYSKKLAIVASALLFGLFHGNPIQTPYTFAVGLVLGYAALEHGILWAIALHLVNNLLYALLLPRVLAFLPGMVVDGILLGLIIICFLAALLVLIAKFRQILAWCRADGLQRWHCRAVFLAPTVVILTVLCLLSFAITMLMLFM